jgi:hypothetical protein
LFSQINLDFDISIYNCFFSLQNYKIFMRNI